MGCFMVILKSVLFNLQFEQVTPRMQISSFFPYDANVKLSPRMQKKKQKFLQQEI